MLTRRMKASSEDLRRKIVEAVDNRQISKALGISERTAGNYVGRILRKLRLRSCAQVAGWATERQLLTPHWD
jgi:DNA-binding CsgD family transcriptional regulator